MYKLNESQIQNRNELLNQPGIYFFSREYNGFRFGYVGQSKHLYDRVVEHLHGFEQHIDLSLKKHGLYDPLSNPTGYKVEALVYCTEEELDQLEVEYCREKANSGYQLRNVTSGSQSAGKFNLHENQQKSKTYRDGVKKGKQDLINELKPMFEKYLDVSMKGSPNRYKENALNKFLKLLS